jgi:putative transposase
LRNTSKALSRFVQRSHTALRDWIQKYKPERLSYRKIMVSKFIIDETQLKVGSEYIWLRWVAIEPKNKQILGLNISKEQNMFVGTERFISHLIKIHGKHIIFLLRWRYIWYPQACKFLKIDHHLHFSYKKSIIERTMQYIKDRTENFDDYFPCRKKNCKLKHVKNRLNLFVDYHNKELKA